MPRLPFGGALGKYFGNAASGAAGYAAGVATAPALRPVVQDIENEAWTRHAVVPPDAYALAAGVAQGQVNHDDAYKWAKQTGFDTGQMDALVAIANVGPGYANALNWLHRQIVGEDGFRRALKRLGWEPEWIDDAVQATATLLSPSELANARQQGFIEQPRQYQEAGWQGVSNERAEIQFELAGLPPGIETALTMLRRKIIQTGEFEQIVREGHTKVKYTDELLALETQILSAATAVRAHLKGHITADQMHQRGAQWGYSPADMDLWYQSEGRPATTHQIHIGYARGASVAGATNEQDAILTAVAQSDVRPEYGPLLYASRYTYPSAFVLRSLVQSGALTAAEGEQALLFSGWEPTFAAKVADSWAGTSGGGAADSHVGKAETQLWTTTHRSYIDEEIDDTAARDALTTLAIDGAAQDQILSLWQKERGLVRKQLTPAQLKKAWQGGVTNPATGAAWTREEALAELVDRGYSPEDATVFLDL